MNTDEQGPTELPTFLKIRPFVRHDFVSHQYGSRFGLSPRLVDAPGIFTSEELRSHSCTEAGRTDKRVKELAYFLEMRGQRLQLSFYVST